MKLFKVRVEGEMFVMATSAQEAERIAKNNIGDDPIDYWAVEALLIHKKSIDQDTLDSYPWGDDGYDKTVGEVFAEMEEKAGIAKAQPELPLTSLSDDEVTRDILSLVLGRVPSIDVIKTWTPEQKQAATDWAGREHLIASDNDDLESLPMPEFLKPFDVPQEQEGIWPKIQD